MTAGTKTVDDEDPFGSDVFGQDVTKIDLWEEDFGDSDIAWGTTTSTNNRANINAKEADEFTVATVSTRHSISGHSRGTIGSGSLLSTPGSMKESIARTCVIEDLAGASVPSSRGVRRTRSHKAASSSSSPRSGSKNEEFHWDPTEVSSTKLGRPRSLRRGFSESSKACLQSKPPSRLRRHRSNQEKDNPISSSTRSRSSAKDSSSNRPCLADSKKSSSLRKLPRRSSISRSNGPTKEERPRGERSIRQHLDEEENKKKEKQSNNGDDLFDIVSVAETKASADRRSRLTRSNSFKTSRSSSRKLGNLGESVSPGSISKSSHNFQRHSGGRPSLGRSSSFKMTVKKNHPSSPTGCSDSEPSADIVFMPDHIIDKEEEKLRLPQKPQSMQNLTRSTSLGGSGVRKPRRRTPTSGGQLPPVTPTQRTRRNRAVPSKSKSVNETTH